MLMLLKVIPMLFKATSVIGGLVKNKIDSGGESHKARGIILASQYGFLFSSMLFTSWCFINIAIIFGYNPPGGLDILIQFKDEIFWLFAGSLGLSAPGSIIGNRVKAKDIEKKYRINTKKSEAQKRKSKIDKSNTLLKIVRDYKKNATYGRVLFDDTDIGIFTLELRNEVHGEINVKGKTCILEGTYDIEVLPHSTSGKYKRTGVIWVKDVPGRTGILGHPGNSTRDSRGCFLPCTKIVAGVGYDSRKATEQLINLIKANKITKLTFFGG